MTSANDRPIPWAPSRRFHSHSVTQWLTWGWALSEIIQHSLPRTLVWHLAIASMNCFIFVYQWLISLDYKQCESKGFIAYSTSVMESSSMCLIALGKDGGEKIVLIGKIRILTVSPSQALKNYSWWSSVPLKFFWFPFLLLLCSLQLDEYGITLRNGFQAGIVTFLLLEWPNHPNFSLVKSSYVCEVMFVRLVYRTG